jgi:hypothetical protein
MTRSRSWTLGAAVLIVLVLVAGWFLLVAPTRADAADIKVQTESQQAQNVQLASKIEQLKVQAQDLPAQEAKLAKFRQRVPTSPALPSYIRSLSSIADSAGVILVSMEPQAPAALEPPKTAAPATTGETAAAGAATTTDVPVTSTSTLQYVQAQVTIRGGYFNTERFLTKLEGLKRAYLVTGFDILPSKEQGAELGDVETHLQVRVFFSAPPNGTATTAPTTATN